MATFTFDTHKHMDNYVDVACKIAARAVLKFLKVIKCK